MTSTHAGMTYRRLGHAGPEVSAIGLGCVTFGREVDQDTSFRILDHAFDRGITLFDTASRYGEDQASERALGAWIRDRGVRDNVVVATKASPPLDRKSIRASIEQSVRLLGVDAIDLFQFHLWDPDTPLEESLAGLDDAVRAGLVKAVGCSNFAAWQLCKSLWMQDVRGYLPFCSIQPIYSLARREIEAELLPLCASEGTGIISYSPLGAGFLTGKYRRGEVIPTGTRFEVKPGHQRVYFNAEGFRALDLLEERSAATGLTFVQLALSWVFRRKGITTVLVGARHTTHVDQAFEAREHAYDPERRFGHDAEP